NTLVLRSDLSGDPPFRALLARVRQGVVEATRHEEMPFERLVEELGVERTLDRSPLFSVLLVLQNALPGTFALPGLTLERLDIDTRTAKFELTLDLGERPDGGLAGSLEYNSDLFDAATAERFARHFVSLAEGIAAEVFSGAGAPLSELPMLGEAERRQLAVEWNATAVAVPSEATIHALILATARRMPEAVAVSCEGATLRYGELAERALRLAGHLAALGVGPDVPVALCAERSPALLVALLGILAAGGAYVPLDP
ncbi:MAG TPA: non-ribosomal peptide synthetase, partial [Acidobacteria bacterium]|nr:non-ribosomal peptide synthetase [Acidobacteriota bacterium]